MRNWWTVLIDNELLLQDVVERIVTEDAVARRIVRQTTVDQTARAAKKKADDAEQAIADADIPTDDFVPPANPTGAVVEVNAHQLIIAWDIPPSTDFVAKTRVRRTKISTSVVVTKSTTTSAITLGALENTAYTIELQHEDRWGHTSSWVNIGNYTPDKTVAEYVDLAAATIAGSLGWTNISTLTDSSKLGTGVITAVSMASQNAAAINLWVQNAAIQSAKIASLTADSITTGTLTATIGVDTGGIINILGSGMLRVRTGATPITRTQVDANGLGLLDTASFAESPDNNKASKLTNLGTTAWSAVNFVDQGSGGYRGNYIVAAGNGGGIGGEVFIEATQDLGSTATGASIQLRRKTTGSINAIDLTAGAVAVHGTLDVDNALTTGGNFTITTGHSLSMTGNATVGNLFLDGSSLLNTNSPTSGVGPRIQPTLLYSFAIGTATGNTTLTSTWVDSAPVVVGLKFNGTNHDVIGNAYQTSQPRIDTINNSNGNIKVVNEITAAGFIVKAYGR